VKSKEEVSSDEEEEVISEYSEVKSEDLFDPFKSEKINVKISEEFSSLLLLLAHNVNLRDLAFEPDDYEFMSHYHHP
jgi:hypothetical protein